MKKIVLCAALAVSLALVLACKSQPPAPPAPSDDVFENVYERYSDALILEGAQTYTVVKGDTLSAISRSKYDSVDHAHAGFYFPVIMLASSSVVLDPDKIEPGMELTIPDLQRNLNDANAKAKIKSFLAEIAVIEDARSREKDAEGLRKLADSL